MIIVLNTSKYILYLLLSDKPAYIWDRRLIEKKDHLLVGPLMCRKANTNFDISYCVILLLHACLMFSVLPHC